MPKPQFALTYWRPWEKSSSFIDSWLNYNKDVSLVEYGAELIGSTMQKLSASQIESIDRLSEKVNNGFCLIADGLRAINKSIEITNYKLDIVIQTQIANHLLLKDIKELLKVPDREKERAFHIENGLRYLKYAETNKEFYKDAYPEFKKAERLKKQDYFTMFNIGMIELYSPFHANIASAKKYFDNVIKYASVDKGSQEYQYLNNLFSQHYNQQNDINDSKFLIVCHIQSALCSYILGDDTEAFNTIVATIHPSNGDYNNDEELYFYAAKFASRLNDLSQVYVIIDHCLNLNVDLINRMTCDFDFLTNSSVNEYLTNYVEKVERMFNDFKKKYKGKSDFLINKNINASLLKTRNSMESKLKFLEFYTEEYILEEMAKEVHNSEIDEKINTLTTKHNIEVERTNQYVSPINSLVAQMREHQNKYEKQPYNDVIGIALTLLILTLMFGGIYLSFKCYDSKSNSDLYLFFFNPLVDIFLIPVMSFGFGFIIKILCENYRDKQYQTLESEYNKIRSKKDSIDVEIQKINSERNRFGSKKYKLQYEVRQF